MSDPVHDELLSYGDELLPGVAKRLASELVDLARLPPHQIPEKVAHRLSGMPGHFWKNPAFLDPDEPRPLRKILNRHLGKLPEGPATAAKLAKAWAGELAWMGEPKMVGEVAARLSPDRLAESLKSVGVALP